MSRTTHVTMLDQVIDWMASIGVRLHNNSRYFSYRKTLAEFATGKPPSGNNEWGQAKSRHITNARYETHEIDRIRRYFEGSEPEGIVDKLNLVVKGPVHFSDEQHHTGKSALPRNTLLELYIGGYMRRYDFTISYGGPKHPEPLVEVNGRRVGFECKRLGVAKNTSIKRNINRAANQLSSRVENKLCDSGIIHLNISKLINPLGKTIIGPHVDTMLESEARFHALRFFRDFANEFDFSEYPHIEAISVNYSHMAKFEQYSNDDMYIQHMMEKEQSSGSSLVAAVRDLAKVNKSTQLPGYTTSTNVVDVVD